MTVRTSASRPPVPSGRPTPPRDHRTGQPRSWPVPAALVALSVIPLTAGSLRLIQLAGGPTVMPADNRFTGFPAALVFHILGAAVFALVGAFQFVPRLRRPRHTWHRQAGWVAAAAGLLVAGSALWLTAVYQAEPESGSLLYLLRIAFASAMIASLLLGITAIRRSDIAAHRAWMIRAYAIGLAAGTQAFTVGIGGATVGTSPLRTDLAKGAAWIINLAVAEWAIRRPVRRHRRRQQPVAPSPAVPAGTPT